MLSTTWKLIMRFSKALLFMLPILLSQTVAQRPSFVHHVCSDEYGNYTSESTYKASLNSALSAISSFNPYQYNGFYSYGGGQDPEENAYAIGFCRGHLRWPENDCWSCLNDSIVALTLLCPNQKEAIGWYDDCMLRFSNRSLVNTAETNAETTPYFFTDNVTNVSYIDGYNEALETLLQNVTNEAAPSDLFGGATTSIVAPDSSMIYALTQCTPDLSVLHCRDCLGFITARIPQFCHGQAGGKAYTPSCTFRYETNPFFDLPAATAPSPHLSKAKESDKIRITIIIVAPTVTGVILGMSFCILWLVIKKRKDHFKTVNKIPSAEFLQFDFATIRAATDNFSDANKLGKGGFGTVYRGRLSNGQDVAVKRLSRNSGQGDLEFKNEVALVAKLQHRNLVRLLGFCLEGSERLLVYEFLPNRSLDQLIFDPKKSADLDSERRYKIISGIARGLLYLHEDSRFRIIHRDLKTGNILLDEKMNPKISDFGMARMCALDQTKGNTNRIAGTCGYMAPEYAMFGQFSIKSDIFSFGVLILEIVSGKKITSFQDEGNEEYLLPYAWRNWKEGTASNLIDQVLTDGRISEMIRCIHIGLLCVQENVDERPNMASVVSMLNSDSVHLPVPAQPGRFIPSTSLQPDMICRVTQCEVSITELSPR